MNKFENDGRDLDSILNGQAFDDVKCTIERLLNHKFQMLIDEFGPTLKGVNNHNLYFVFKIVQPCISFVKDTSNVLDQTKQYFWDESKAINHIDMIAKDTINQLKLKLEEKIGTLDQCSIEYINGDREFRIVGEKDGHKVQISQTTIINCSHKGTVFNQFPMRIKLDGKSCSAKEYNEMFK